MMMNDERFTILESEKKKTVFINASQLYAGFNRITFGSLLSFFSIIFYGDSKPSGFRFLMEFFFVIILKCSKYSSYITILITAKMKVPIGWKVNEMKF